MASCSFEINLSQISSSRISRAEELIEKMEGGFDKMNQFVQKTIYDALQASHQHFETTFKGESILLA